MLRPGAISFGHLRLGGVRQARQGVIRSALVSHGQVECGRKGLATCGFATFVKAAKGKAGEASHGVVSVRCDAEDCGQV